MKSFVRFITGFVLGALVGAAAAVLFAPMAGEELRGRMMAEADRLRGEIKQAALEKRAVLEQQLASLRQPRTPPTAE